MATLTCPACAAEVQQDDLICFTCGANLPRRNPADEPAHPAHRDAGVPEARERTRPGGRTVVLPALWGGDKGACRRVLRGVP